MLPCCWENCCPHLPQVSPIALSAPAPLFQALWLLVLLDTKVRESLCKIRRSSFWNICLVKLGSMVVKDGIWRPDSAIY